jgi:predicted O-linked N-acetylglucosamine transferase (SPINDLY family)
MALTLRPAPVQLSYLGYPATTGLECVDARIGDILTDGNAGFQPATGRRDACAPTEYVEPRGVIRLPRCYLAFRPDPGAPPVADRPAGDPVFGYLGNLSKVSPQTLDLWAAAMRAIPKSKMIIKSHALDDAQCRAALCKNFADREIDPARLDLRPWLAAHRAHLETYNEIDVALDTFPYNGTTTTCEALWQGVPVFSLVGNTHHSRQGFSILTAALLQGCLTSVPDNYASVCEWVFEHYTIRRAEIRARMEQSSLCDGVKLARALEHEYERLFIDVCKGE